MMLTQNKQFKDGTSSAKNRSTSVAGRIQHERSEDASYINFTSLNIAIWDTQSR